MDSTAATSGRPPRQAPSAGSARATTRQIAARIAFSCLAVLMAAAPAIAQLKTYPRRIPAPSLSGAGDWINTAGPIDLPDLRGKFVLLDFWTFCCINCMHILPELKKLEAAYPNHVVVIGVHSAKFASEKDTENIRQAVLRYDIEHPVVNDGNLLLWRKYGVDVWPSLRVIDPEGNLVAYHVGEIKFDELDRYFKGVIPSYRRRGLLDETPLRFDLDTYKVQPTPLRFPGKVLADSSTQRLYISDSGNHRIVVTSLDGKLLAVIGAGEAGNRDGAFDEARFDHPQGMALYRDDLYVADTENHCIRKIDFSTKRVTTVAGNGNQAKSAPRRASAAPTVVSLASPWDLWLHEKQLYIAMAGLHQIWQMSPDDRVIGPFAGNAAEDIVDGPRLAPTPYQSGFASFAQPSGLASDGRLLFVADSEGSSIRVIPLEGRGAVSTILGTAGQSQARLFTFGDRDGPAGQALLQHPLGVACTQSTLFIADTYNSKIKRIRLDRQPLAIETVLDADTGLDEPSGLSIAGDRLYIADTNNHRICFMDLAAPGQLVPLAIDGLSPPDEAGRVPFGAIPDTEDNAFDAVRLKSVAGSVKAKFTINLPPGCKLNEAAPMSYAIQVVQEGLIDPVALNTPIRIQPPSTAPLVKIPVLKDAGESTVRLRLVYYYCEEGAEALCRIDSVSWTGQIIVDPAGSPDPLDLRHDTP